MIRISLKIQVKANTTKDDQRALPWADLEQMPEFHSYAEANQWLIDSGTNRLCAFGLSFRIVPEDFPCTYIAALDRNLKQQEVQA